jgi:hypothetical protein
VNNILYNGKYWFYLNGKDTVIVPIPGDVVIKSDKSMYLIASVLFLEENSELNLDIAVFKEQKVSVGRGGKKSMVMAVEALDYSKEALDNYTILRGSEIISPISLKFKALNLYARIKNYIKNFLKNK